MLVDVTATDHLLDGVRYAPEGLELERYEIVAKLPVARPQPPDPRHLRGAGRRPVGAVTHARIPGRELP